MNQLLDKEFSYSLKQQGHFFDVCVTPHKRTFCNLSSKYEEIKSARLDPTKSNDYKKGAFSLDKKRCGANSLKPFSLKKRVFDFDTKNIEFEFVNNE